MSKQTVYLIASNVVLALVLIGFLVYFYGYTPFTNKLLSQGYNAALAQISNSIQQQGKVTIILDKGQSVTLVKEQTQSLPSTTPAPTPEASK